MAQIVSVLVSIEDRVRLAAVIDDRNRPHKHVQRARIILLSVERLAVLEIARLTGMSRPSVWRWQQRFAEEGVDGLLRDKTRKPGRAPLSAATVAKTLALPCGPAPKGATHWLCGDKSKPRNQAHSVAPSAYGGTDFCAFSPQGFGG